MSVEFTNKTTESHFESCSIFCNCSYEVSLFNYINRIRNKKKNTRNTAQGRSGANSSSSVIITTTEIVRYFLKEKSRKDWIGNCIDHNE